MQLETKPHIETKSADPAQAFDEFNRTFHAFKETNDDRLAQIESRQAADPLTEAKLARINSALDDTKSRLDKIAIEKARPRLGETKELDHGTRERKAAFRAYMAQGDASKLTALEAKTLSESSNPDGGYLAG